MSTTTKIQIRSRWDGSVLHEGDYVSILEALAGAMKAEANLTGANLYEANLTGANLSRANLSRANLTGANLTGANLYEANLYGADLYGADLTEANLYGANLTGANLTEANLSRANLTGANLTEANLTGADLTGADLTEANLSRANLTDSKEAALAIAKTRHLPQGSIIGWKKCKAGVIVKLRIPEEAKRSHAFGRKCRAEFADVVEVIGADVGRSLHDSDFTYKAGERVMPDVWCEDWQRECAGGIHFFITREEAEAYDM